MEIVVMNNKYYLLRWTLLGKRNLYTLDFTDRIMNTYIQYMCNEFDPSMYMLYVQFCFVTTLHCTYYHHTYIHHAIHIQLCYLSAYHYAVVLLYHIE